MKKTQKDLAFIYHLPEATTLEALETYFFASRAVFLTYGDKVLMANYFYNGSPKDPNNYYGAIYEFTTEDHGIEGEVRLAKISEEFFFDNGTAIRWGMEW